MFMQRLTIDEFVQGAEDYSVYAKHTFPIHTTLTAETATCNSQRRVDTGFSDTAMGLDISVTFCPIHNSLHCGNPLPVHLETSLTLFSFTLFWERQRKFYASPKPCPSIFPRLVTFHVNGFIQKKFFLSVLFQ